MSIYCIVTICGCMRSELLLHKLQVFRACFMRVISTTHPFATGCTDRLRSYPPFTRSLRTPSLLRSRTVDWRNFALFTTASTPRNTARRTSRSDTSGANWESQRILRLSDLPVGSSRKKDLRFSFVRRNGYSIRILKSCSPSSVRCQTAVRSTTVPSTKHSRVASGYPTE